MCDGGGAMWVDGWVSVCVVMVGCVYMWCVEFVGYSVIYVV